MTFSRVNAGHVAGQAVLIADHRRKNGFEVSEKKRWHSTLSDWAGFIGRGN